MGRLEGDPQAGTMYKELDPTHLEWEDQGSVRLQYRPQLQAIVSSSIYCALGPFLSAG